MAVNPYTLNQLYQNGILDYVPTDLMMGNPVGSMLTPMVNPYLNMAQQGALYQNHGTATDSFHSSFTPAYTPNNYQSVSSSANSYVGLNNYSGMPPQIGSRSNAGGMAAFNGYGIGKYNNNGFASAVGEDGTIGYMSNAGGMNSVGGFADTQNNISSGINKVSSVINNTPKIILGVVAGAIGLVGLAALFKRGKKPANTGNHSSFWSKLNPVNWFKKNK